MNREKKIYKVKCKHCKTILTTEIQAFQTCQCGKVSYDTDNPRFQRIVGNQEDYEIIYDFISKKSQ